MPTFGNRDRVGVAGIPDSLYRRMRTNAASSVKDGRYYLQLAGAEARERLLLAAAALWNVPVAELTAKNSVITHAASGRTTTYGAIARRAAETPHPHPETITIKPPDQWTLMGTEQKNLDVPSKVTGQAIYGIDVRLPGMKWAAVKTCPVYGGDVKRYDFEAIRTMPGVRSAVQFPIPDPALTRGRDLQRRRRRHRRHLVPGEDRDRQDADRVGDSARQCGVHVSANMRESLIAALDRPGTVRANQGDVDAAFRSAARIVEATYSTPFLPRARMEPGNATVLVSNDRVDIWIGDQSPQETRFSAAKITGIPETNVHLHLCHLGGGFGRNGNGPQAEHAIMIANAHRGTPIHMLWTREEDFIGTTYRAMGVARLKAALDADGWPIALEVRTAMQEGGFGPEASFHVTSRYHVPNYRYSNHTTKFHVPVGTRRGVGQAAHEFYRESFMDELARAAGKDPYRYRRELLARTNLPYKQDMITALDMAAEMSGWGTPLPKGTARAIALEERGAESDGMATISAMVHTVSVSREGKVQTRTRGRRARDRLRPGQPAVGEEADRRPDHLVLQRCHAPGLHHQGRPHRREQLPRVPDVAHQRRPADDQHPLLPDAALADRHGPRPRHVGAVGDRRRDLPDHRQALPRSAVRQTRPELDVTVPSPPESAMTSTSTSTSSGSSSSSSSSLSSFSSPACSPRCSPSAGC